MRTPIPASFIRVADSLRDLCALLHNAAGSRRIWRQLAFRANARRSSRNEHAANQAGSHRPFSGGSQASGCPAKAASATPSAAATLPEPPPPNWPINDHPAPATISWDSSGLRINAANSSLRQILADVATATGAKVEGLGSDERVYGDYGPGPVRDVLSQLLQGSSYNILMLGDQAQGEPLQIVLSARHSGPAPATAGATTPAENDDDAAETEIDNQPLQPSPMAPIHPGLVPEAPCARLSRFWRTCSASSRISSRPSSRLHRAPHQINSSLPRMGAIREARLYPARS